MALRIDDFKKKLDAAYRAELEKYPAATANLLSHLNDHDNEQRMIHMSEVDLPALLGVVNAIERDEAIAEVIAPPKAGLRYPQAIGTGVKLKMLDQGWKTTGRKGSLPKSRFFKSAEIAETALRVVVGKPPSTKTWSGACC